MGIKNIDENLCNGCGICVDNCPMDVIRIREDDARKAYIAYPGDCMVCYQCEDSCPEDAIELTAEMVRKLMFPF